MPSYTTNAADERANPCRICQSSSTGTLARRGLTLDAVLADHAMVGEYALITAAVASLAISLATIPEGKLAERLPTTAAKARALVAQRSEFPG